MVLLAAAAGSSQALCVTLSNPAFFSLLRLL